MADKGRAIRQQARTVAHTIAQDAHGVARPSPVEKQAQAQQVTTTIIQDTQRHTKAKAAESRLAYDDKPHNPRALPPEQRSMIYTVAEMREAASRNQSRQDLTPHRETRLRDALATKQQPDPKGYQGEPLREYQKELARQIEARQHPGNGPRDMGKIDQTIMRKMLESGYKPQEITRAVGQGSPNVVGKDPKQREAYVREKAAPLLKDKALITTCATLEKARQHQRKPQDRRLAYSQQLKQALQQKQPSHTQEHSHNR